jgi:arginase
MDINIIGVPIFYGADRKGPEHAPEKFREKNIAKILSEHNHNVFDFGNIHVPEVEDADKFSSHSNMKYFEAIAEVNKNIAHAVYTSIEAGSFPLVVGGDHSVGLGSISGISKVYENFAVIWMDAHGDINTHDTSGSGNVHGMPLANAMGIGHPELTNLYFEGRKVNPQNVFIVGARDLDEGELELINKENLNVYSSEEINKDGIERVLNDILQKLKEKNIDAVHLSFDLDFIDYEFVPGTGTPVHNGVSVEDTKYILKALAQTKLIKSMDFVELNTLLDKNDVTADLAIDLLDFTFKNMQI